jgi:hypothetical protein
MATAYGRIIGQEILKAIPNKFPPILQFLDFGVIESLPSTINFSLNKIDTIHIIEYFGNEQVEAMHKLRCFLIG